MLSRVESDIRPPIATTTGRNRNNSTHSENKLLFYQVSETLVWILNIQSKNFDVFDMSTEQMNTQILVPNHPGALNGKGGKRRRTGYE